MISIIIIVMLVLSLGIFLGYAARQMQTLRENADTIKEKDAEIEGLVRQNERLLRTTKDHETNLEMVLTELDKSE